jgi:hypothetical protein
VHREQLVVRLRVDDVRVGLRELSPACASWARITSARTPPARKNARLVAMYMIPIRLWSVVVIQLTTRPSYQGTG